MTGLLQRILKRARRVDGRQARIFFIFFASAIFWHVWNHPRNIEVAITATLPTGVKTTLFHAKINQFFKESRSIKHINQNPHESTHTFFVRTWGSTGQLRWDPMEHPGRMGIQRVVIANQTNQLIIQAPDIHPFTQKSQDIQWQGVDAYGHQLESTGGDPYLVWQVPDNLHAIPIYIWFKHTLTVFLLAGLLTSVFAWLERWLITQTQQKGRVWFLGTLSQSVGLLCLCLSASHLSLQHGWWTWGLVLQANERDGIRQALPPLIQDAKVLLRDIDPNTPVSLSPSWRGNYFNYYAAEEYLYPRRLSEQADLRLIEKGMTISPQCEPVKEHGSAVLLQCHD